MNIVLIGYRCSGKSAVGGILAEKTGLKPVDTDRLLEKRVGLSIDRYVAENGWERFRAVEKMIVRSVSGQDRQVIATGGGVVLDWENVGFLRDGGWVVWLKTSVFTLKERMLVDEQSGHVRPGILAKNPLNEIERILTERTPLYERAADFRVKTDGKSLETVLNEILHAMPRGQGRPERVQSPQETASLSAMTA